MVKLVLVGNCVKLSALHLAESWQAFLTGANVTDTIAFPFSSAVVSSKLWSTKRTLRLGCDTGRKVVSNKQ